MGLYIGQNISKHALEKNDSPGIVIGIGIFSAGVLILDKAKKLYLSSDTLNEPLKRDDPHHYCRARKKNLLY